MQREVLKSSKGVKILFKGEIKKHNIVQMVQNCATGKCECMSEETKQRIKDMQVRGEDGQVELELHGEIDKEEIEAALQRSKILNRN